MTASRSKGSSSSVIALREVDLGMETWGADLTKETWEVP